MDFNDLELSERLLIARRGTAFFAQRLAELTDDELDGDTLLDGWTRKQLLAHVGYNAAALCRLLDWAAPVSKRRCTSRPNSAIRKSGRALR